MLFGKPLMHFMGITPIPFLFTASIACIYWRIIKRIPFTRHPLVAQPPIGLALLHIRHGILAYF